MTRFAVIIAPRVIKQIQDLPSGIRRRVERVIAETLAHYPFIGKSLKAKYEGLYSYRVGDYRIIYAVSRHKVTVFILKVAHRRETYR